MGEIADMMLDGTLCECCGVYIDYGDADGFPRYCEGCKQYASEETRPKRKRRRRRKKRKKRTEET